MTHESVKLHFDFVDGRTLDVLLIPGDYFVTEFQKRYYPATSMSKAWYEYTCGDCYLTSWDGNSHKKDYDLEELAKLRNKNGDLQDFGECYWSHP